MPPVPLLRPRDVLAVFESFGWRVSRQRGSHVILTKEGGVVTLSVPNHTAVSRGTLRSLIRTAGLTVEEFTARLEAR